ncbi:glycosyltransferase family 2 protein [Roseovarius sp. EL26]|uniref:glycosyltransferase family 2 protein n=1 Tax=Roseovarius sp. EL26 TaxID=2126672 RepID=UPI000EA3FD8A|nr:glycosyltransferase family 2 protein [Roseovarius sp. EL26]
MRVLSITTMRNETPFILEWLAYHRLIGVTDFLIYSNDCDDGTDLMLEHLQTMGLVTHQPNPRSSKKTVQWKALGRARNHPLMKAADWIMVSDVDEFLCIHAGGGHINDLLSACPDAEGFAIDWRMFGNNGIVKFEDRPMIEQFTQAAPDVMLWPWRAVQFKSLYRASNRYERLGVHRPKLRKGENRWQNWVNGSGRSATQLLGTVVPSVAPRYELAQFNHYALGSIENFLVKADRGKPNRSDDPIDLPYWIDRNFNTQEDTRILRHAKAVEEQVALWKEDAELNKLHQAGVAWRHQRIQDLIQDTETFLTLTRIRQAGGSEALPVPEQKALFEHFMKLRRRLLAQQENGGSTSPPNNPPNS